MYRRGVRKGLRARAGTAVAIAAAIGLPAFGPPSDVPSGPRAKGYLGAAGVPHEEIFLPPPPADASIAGKADLAIFRATRSQRGSQRWQLATRDAAADPASMLDDFGCSLGTRLRPEAVPQLSHLMQRTMSDAVAVIGPPKERYRRPRPFRRARGPVCTPMSPEFRRSGSYPSGHSTVGWLYALILAELAPDRATAVLARGREFGESRVICGVHYVSDVEAGNTAAASLVAVLHGNAEFRADMAAAKEELTRVRTVAPAADQALCRIETALLAQPAW